VERAFPERAMPAASGRSAPPNANPIEVPSAGGPALVDHDVSHFDILTIKQADSGKVSPLCFNVDFRIIGLRRDHAIEPNPHRERANRSVNRVGDRQ
jgi:hypothetical protein